MARNGQESLLIWSRFRKSKSAPVSSDFAMSLTYPQAYRFGEYTLDMKTGYLLRSGSRIDLDGHLTKTPRKVLEYMLENTHEPNTLFRRTPIIDAVWGVGHVIEHGTLDKHIAAIRRALGNDEDQGIIETVSGMGFRFKLSVAKIYEKDGIQPTAVSTNEDDHSLPTPYALSSKDFSRKPNDHSSKQAEPELSAAQNDPIKPVLTFQAWRIGPGKHIKWFLIFGVVATMISLAWGFRNWSDAEIKLVIGLVQSTLLLGLFADFVFLRAPADFRSIERDLNEDGTLRSEVIGWTKSGDTKEWGETRIKAAGTAKRYALYWAGVLASWFLLYVCVASQGIPPFSSHPTALSIVTTFFNNCSTAFFILSYNILNKRTDFHSGRLVIADSHLILSCAFFTGAFSIIEWIFVGLFTGDSNGVAIVRLSATLVSGILGGIGMALYVGRLQSKFLAPSSKLVAAFFSYTAIQSLFVFLVEGPTARVVTISPEVAKAIAAFLITLALVLKALLYLYTSWLFHGGRILFYFVRTIHTDREIDEEWEGFTSLISPAKRESREIGL